MMEDIVDIRWIEDFLSLAQTRSFSRSAEERGITQSALSKRIRALEQWVGADLIDRRGFPMGLTPSGVLFAHAARDGVKALTDARAALRKETRGRRLLRIAAGHTLAQGFVPQWLRAAGAPGASIQAANVHDAVLALMEGECDLLVCYDHPDLPLVVDRAQFEQVAAGTESLVPVSVPARSGAPLFALPASADRPIPLLAYGKDSYFGRVVDVLTARASPGALARACESDMADVLKALALTGQGLAWLPASSVGAELAQGRLVHAGGAAWRFELDIVFVFARPNDHVRALVAASHAGMRPG
nr:LysR family transcriptional regulator [Massilia rhizosphaerae]